MQLKFDTSYRHMGVLRQVATRMGLAMLLVCGVMQEEVRAEAVREEVLAPLPVDWQPATFSRSLGFDLTSRYTGQTYRILLGLPHKPAPAGGYPVLWALDGLASFPLMETARPRPVSANESAQWRRKIGDEPAGLIVAIGYASGDPIDVNARALDYTPVTSGSTGDTFSSQHGGEENFLRFLTEELRPLIASHFAINPERNTLFGFSYGGLFTLNTLARAPGFFQRYWASSPSLWFGGHQTMKLLPDRLKNNATALTGVNKVMITVGSDEQYPASFSSEQEYKKLQERTMVDNAEQYAQALQAQGLAVSFEKLPAHDHMDMLMHGARRVVGFAFAP
ncbi:hypothetical protein SAMN05192560_0921 [Methylobacillus rhizosphaerae]|uniref:Esterase n=1 Tax=Methylobacillus rhizosphaerae TaxID=551994 RepID=A0A238YZ02_9PROT|nr:hypothetical protein SAMN05192560_0921 [Methylobacillus rhizosphaerae]